MDRRELLKMVAAATGSIVIGGEFFLAGCTNPEAAVGGKTFTEDDIAFLDEVAETIFPKTNTPGAKEAKVGEFMKVFVNDCYTEKQQETFHSGINALNEACKEKHGHGFMKASAEQRKELLTSIDKEVTGKRKDFNQQQDEIERAETAKGNAYKRESMPAHYFTLMKQLTITGYFTSEAGRKGATNYQEVPGRFDGNVPFRKGVDKVLTGLD